MKDFQRQVVSIGPQKSSVILKVTDENVFSRIMTTKIVQQKNAQEKVLKLNLALLADDIEYMSLQKVPLVGGGQICRINMPIRFLPANIKKLLKAQSLALCDFLGFPPHSDDFNSWIEEISEYVKPKEIA